MNTVILFALLCSIYLMHAANGAAAPTRKPSKSPTRTPTHKPSQLPTK